MGDSGSIKPHIDTHSGSSFIREIKTNDDFERLIGCIFPNNDFYDFDFHVARRNEERRLYQKKHGNLVGGPPSIEMTRLFGKFTVKSPDGTERTIIDPYVKRWQSQKDRNGKYYIGLGIELVENNETRMVNDLGKLTAPPFKIFLPFHTTDPPITDIVFYDNIMSGTSNECSASSGSGGRRSRISKRKIKRRTKKRKTKRFVKK
jgi:hypothetical protein